MNYDGSVRDASGKSYQFRYGEDIDVLVLIVVLLM